MTSKLIFIEMKHEIGKKGRITSKIMALEI